MPGAASFDDTRNEASAVPSSWLLPAPSLESHTRSGRGSLHRDSQQRSTIPGAHPGFAKKHKTPFPCKQIRWLGQHLAKPGVELPCKYFRSTWVFRQSRSLRPLCQSARGRLQGDTLLLCRAGGRAQPTGGTQAWGRVGGTCPLGGFPPLLPAGQPPPSPQLRSRPCLFLSPTRAQSWRLEGHTGCHPEPNLSWFWPPSSPLSPLIHCLLSAPRQQTFARKFGERPQTYKPAQEAERKQAGNCALRVNIP